MQLLSEAFQGAVLAGWGWAAQLALCTSSLPSTLQSPPSVSAKTFQGPIKGRPRLLTQRLDDPFPLFLPDFIISFLEIQPQTRKAGEIAREPVERLEVLQLSLSETELLIFPSRPFLTHFFTTSVDTVAIYPAARMHTCGFILDCEVAKPSAHVVPCWLADAL